MLKSNKIIFNAKDAKKSRRLKIIQRRKTTLKKHKIKIRFKIDYKKLKTINFG